jgi:hypothetical protein
MAEAKTEAEGVAVMSVPTALAATEADKGRSRQQLNKKWQ